MPTCRQGSAAAGLSKCFYVIGGVFRGGGSRQSQQHIQVVECFDYQACVWRSLPPVPTPSITYMAAGCAGKLFVLMPDVAGTCCSFDPTTNTWSGLPPLPTP